MMHVAEKLGIRLEGRERELVQWQDQWQDRLRYGLLRREWLDKDGRRPIQSKSM